VYRGLFFGLCRALGRQLESYCHRAAVFRPGADRALKEFTTARAQILNQSPELTERSRPVGFRY
jgi:hypothetical protein